MMGAAGWAFSMGDADDFDLPAREYLCASFILLDISTLCGPARFLTG